MTVGVTVDASKLVRAMAKLSKGLEKASERRGLEHATRTADTIRGGVPVLTGRLQNTVRATRIVGGGAVHYGGTLPYAWKIERSTHTVERALKDAPGGFHRVMFDAAQHEVDAL